MLVCFHQLVTELILRAYSSYLDHELLDAIRHDDETAFAELFKRYGKVVYKMAYSRIRSQETAEEIVQNLFISFWERRRTQLIHNISSYFYTAVKRKVLNLIESQLVRKRYWDYYRNFTPQEENLTERTVEFNELLEAIIKSMEHLPEKSKKVFKLSHMEGRSIAEIANSLNLSKKAIQYHLRCSLKELRLHLKDFI